MKRNTLPYWIVNKLGDGTPEIYLYGDIYPYEECVNASGLAKELKEMERTTSKINVRINSGGGSVYEGMAIFNLLRNSKCEIDTYIDGIAASMGSVIALAGKRVYMSKYAQLMTHRPSGSVWGTAEEMRKTAELLEGVEKIINSIYQAKTGLSEAKVTELFLNGTDVWLNSQKALNAKLIDGEYDSPPIDIPDQVTNVHDKWAVYNSVLRSNNQSNSLIILS